MTSTKLIAVARMAACLLAGWIAGSGGQAAHAQETTEPEPVVETQSESDCRFEIPSEVRLDGQPVLLDQCTGDTWRFDDGWDSDTNTYTSSYSWVAIERE